MRGCSSMASSTTCSRLSQVSMPSSLPSASANRWLSVSCTSRTESSTVRDARGNALLLELNRNGIMVGARQGGKPQDVGLGHRTAQRIQGGSSAVSGYQGMAQGVRAPVPRSEEHTSELQSLMRISYAVFC